MMVLEQGARIIPLDIPWLTIERIESYSFDTGRSVMKSIEICAKGQIVVGGRMGLSWGCPSPLILCC